MILFKEYIYISYTYEVHMYIYIYTHMLFTVHVSFGCIQLAFSNLEGPVLALPV